MGLDNAAGMSKAWWAWLERGGEETCFALR